MQGAVQAGSALPQELRIIGNPAATPDAAQRQKYEDYYQAHYGAPAEAQARAGAYGSGRSDSAFAGGQIGQLMGENMYRKFMAGEQLSDNYLQRLIAARGSFAGLEGNMSQAYNQLNQARGSGLAGMAMQDAAGRNSYALGSAQMANNYSQAAYQGQLSAYDRLQDYNKFQTQNNLALGSGIGGAIGGLVGGIGGESNAPGKTYGAYGQKPGGVAPPPGGW